MHECVSKRKSERMKFRVVKELNGKRYKLGAASSSGDGHVDCLMLLKEFLLVDFGISLPVSYKGITLSNYSSWYSKNPVKTMEQLSSFLMDNFSSINPRNVSIGDIIIFNYDDSDAVALGIVYGNGYALTVDIEMGFIITKSSSFKIKECYRCLQPSQ